MRVLVFGVALLVCPVIIAQTRVPIYDIRSAGSLSGHHLDSAMSSISAADDAIGAMQRMLERDASVLAKLREARQVLEEETQPMTVVNAVAVRVAEASRMEPHNAVRYEIRIISDLVEAYRQSSASIDLPLLTRHVDSAVNVASDVVVQDVRMMQPTLAAITRMQEVLQARLSGLVQAQGRAMERTAARPR